MERSTIIDETCKRLEELGGKRIEIVNDTTLSFDAVTEYWKKSNASKNIIRFNGNLPATNHLIMHELTHLSMFINNTIANNGKLVLFSDNSEALLFSKYADAWERIGKYNKKSPKEVASLIKRCSYAYTYSVVNLALDLFVERFLFENYPSLKNTQEVSLSRMENENIASDTSPLNRNIPPRISSHCAYYEHNSCPAML